MKPYEIAEKIQQLEALSAESLGNNANYLELAIIWKNIKYLRTQLLFIEFFENVLYHRNSVSVK